jgi:hypothetical protein
MFPAEGWERAIAVDYSPIPSPPEQVIAGLDYRFWSWLELEGRPPAPPRNERATICTNSRTPITATMRSHNGQWRTGASCGGRVTMASAHSDNINIRTAIWLCQRKIGKLLAGLYKWLVASG